MAKYVIIGGGMAGGRACQGIRRIDAEGSVVLVTAERHMPYERPPLSKGYLMRKQGLDKVYLKEDAYYAENHIDVVQGVRAERVDRATQQVALSDGRTLEYDRLLLATGGRAWRLPIPGSELPGVLILRTIENSDAIHEAATPGQRVLVIGGSFIGSEVASSVTQLGAKATMVFPEPRLLERVVPEELSAFLHEMYKGKGVRILAGTKPEAIEGTRKAERVRLDSGEVVDVDVVVMGVGIRLNTELARDAGLELTERGAIVVDKFLRTGDPHIHAAGDIAAWPDPTFGKRLRVEHWDVARLQGMRAGRNMAGEEKPYTALPYFFSDLFEFSFEAWGDLSSWDQTVRRGTIASGSFAFYYFSQGRMAGVLAVDRPDAERDPMQALVKARPSYGDVAAKLGDEGFDLGTLAG